jgi:addiction module RelE/StbE family toxin
MKIRLSRDAIRDIDEIHDYIARDNQRAAARVTARIRSAIERLADHPLGGRIGQLPGTREWLVSRLPYLIIYRVDEEPPSLLIARVYHTSRDRRAEMH